MLSSFKVLVKVVFSLVIKSTVIGPLVAIIFNKRVIEGQYVHLIDYHGMGFFFQNFIFRKGIMVYHDVLVTDNPTKTLFHCQRTPPLLILISDLNLLFSSIWQPTNQSWYIRSTWKRNCKQDDKKYILEKTKGISLSIKATKIMNVPSQEYFSKHLLKEVASLIFLESNILNNEII